MEVLPLADAHRPELERLVRQRWGSTRVVSRGQVWDLGTLPGLVAWGADGSQGCVLYRLHEHQAELVLLLAEPRGEGIGTALLEALVAELRTRGLRRLWLVTTNDNLAALRFYQRRGFALVAVHRDALARSRELKPSIPLVGEHGIPLRDELELEVLLRS